MDMVAAIGRIRGAASTRPASMLNTTRKLARSNDTAGPGQCVLALFLGFRLWPHRDRSCPEPDQIHQQMHMKKKAVLSTHTYMRLWIAWDDKGNKEQASNGRTNELCHYRSLLPKDYKSTNVCPSVCWLLGIHSWSSVDIRRLWLGMGGQSIFSVHLSVELTWSH